MRRRLGWMSYKLWLPSKFSSYQLLWHFVILELRVIVGMQALLLWCGSRELGGLDL